MATQQADEFMIGEQVIRKSDLGDGRHFYGRVGTVERMWTNRRSGKHQAYVRWHGALNLVGGRTDNHSTLMTAALLPANEENLAKLEARRQRIKEAARQYQARKAEEYRQQYADLQVGEMWYVRCTRSLGKALVRSKYTGNDSPTVRRFHCGLCGMIHLVDNPDGILSGSI